MKLNLPKYLKNTHGFTIVELLIVITVIGLLAGITLSITNSGQQRAAAEDAVKQANLSKAAEGLETFFHAEGFYPEDDASNPLEGSDGDILAIYLSEWPEDTVYAFDPNISGSPEFAVFVQKSTNEDFFKYRSTTSTVDDCDDTTPPDVTSCIPPVNNNPPPATVASIALSPTSATMVVGEKKQFTAIATYSDGTTGDVTTIATWSITSSLSGGGTVDKGLVTATTAGTATLTASYGGKSANVQITITNGVPGPTVTSVTLLPTSASMTVGGTQQFTATANFSDGTSQNVTSTATWSVTNGTGSATVSAGLVTATGAGSATVNATYQGKTGNAGLTISGTGGKTVTSISVLPASKSLTVGQTTQMTARAYYSDGSVADVTTNSGTNWSITTGALVASVNNTTQKGLVTANNAGTATVQATFSAKSDTSTITVTSSLSCTSNFQCVSICGCSTAVCKNNLCDCSSCAI